MATASDFQNIRQDKLAVKNLIGEGGFGSVYRALHKDWQTEVAVKVCCAETRITERDKDEILQEAKKITAANHPNIVRLYGLCMTKKYYGLVMEYMPHGSLSSVLHRPGVTLPWPLRIKFLYETSLGMNFLHNIGSVKMLHLDLKPDNELLDEDMHIKLSDFGMSALKNLTSTIKTMEAAKGGTYTHIPPEHLDDMTIPATEKFDVFSFGIVIWEVLTRSRPYKDNVTWFNIYKDNSAVVYNHGE